jgi:hypothetical protein
MSDTVDIDLLNLRQGMDALYKAVESIALRPPAQPEIANRSLTGDHIRGGTIVKFQSVGIKDDATQSILLVNDKGVHTDNLNIKNLLGDTNVTGNLYVQGEITAKKLHVSEITADVRIERTTPIEFLPEEGKDVYGKGLFWRSKAGTRQLVYRANPDRFWSSDSIDLNEEAYFAIGNTPVLRAKELGPSVTNSNLTTVGTLRDLRTQGNFNVDEYFFYESASQRVGFGTESPNGTIGVASTDGEFIIDVDTIKGARIGNWTASDLEIITDNTPRIAITSSGHIIIGSNVEAKTTIQGKLGINIKNPDCDIVTAGPVKFQGKKQEVGEDVPTQGAYKLGDIVWNSKPRPTGYVGWICTRDGTPGEWKPFGQIAS